MYTGVSGESRQIQRGRRVGRDCRVSFSQPRGGRWPISDFVEELARDLESQVSQGTPRLVVLPPHLAPKPHCGPRAQRVGSHDAMTSGAGIECKLALQGGREFDGEASPACGMNLVAVDGAARIEKDGARRVSPGHGTVECHIVSTQDKAEMSSFVAMHRQVAAAVITKLGQQDIGQFQLPQNLAVVCTERECIHGVHRLVEP